MITQPIVMLDFETTGMSPEQGARITEVAALRIVDGQVVERFVSLVNCRARIPPFIAQLTGISQAMVDRAPDVAAVIPALLDFIGNDTLAAHNASFDEKFLLAEYARQGLGAGHSRTICSLKLARRTLPGMSSYSLSALASSLGLRFKGRAHRAEADAEVSAHLLLHIAGRVCADHGLPSLDASLLAHINTLPAGKVASWLRQRATALV